MTKGSTDLDSEGIVSKTPIRVYNINDDTLTSEEFNAIVKLLVDPIVDDYKINSPVLGCIPFGGSISIMPPSVIDSVVIEMSQKPGVNDPKGKTAKDAIEREIGRKIGDVSFAEQYFMERDFK